MYFVSLGITRAATLRPVANNDYKFVEKNFFSRPGEIIVKNAEDEAKVVVRFIIFGFSHSKSPYL